MYKIINVLLFLVIISLFFYGYKSGADGYKLLGVSALFYTLIGNAIFLTSKRRIRKGESIIPEYILFTLMIFFGSSITYAMGSTLCDIECFGIDITFFNTFLLVLSSIFFIIYFYLTMDNKQRIIGGIITMCLLGIFLYNPILNWYKETYIITRYSNSIYHKDKDNVYCDLTFGERIPGVYVESFTAIDDIYGKDEKYIYFLCNILVWADPKTFRVFPGDSIYTKSVDMTRLDGGTSGTYTKNIYSKDKDQIFYLGKRIPGADVATFQTTGSGYAKDAFHTYLDGVLKE